MPRCLGVLLRSRIDIHASPAPPINHNVHMYIQNNRVATPKKFLKSTTSQNYIELELRSCDFLVSMLYIKPVKKVIFFYNCLWTLSIKMVDISCLQVKGQYDVVPQENNVYQSSRTTVITACVFCWPQHDDSHFPTIWAQGSISNGDALHKTGKKKEWTG